MATLVPRDDPATTDPDLSPRSIPTGWITTAFADPTDRPGPTGDDAWMPPALARFRRWQRAGRPPPPHDA